MPVTRSAKKALRKSDRKQVINIRRKRSLRDIIKQARETHAAEKIRQAISQIDKAVKNHLLQQNKAGHLKSQLMKESKSSPKTASKPKAKKALKKQVKKITKPKALDKKKL